MGIDSYIRVSYGDYGSMSIEVPAKELVKDHPYDLVYTENGCDVIVHFRNGGANK